MVVRKTREPPTFDEPGDASSTSPLISALRTNLLPSLPWNEIVPSVSLLFTIVFPPSVELLVFPKTKKPPLVSALFFTTADVALEAVVPSTKKLALIAALVKFARGGS